MSHRLIHLDIEESGLAVLTLSNPQGGNAMSLAFCEEFGSCVETLAQTPGLRAILVKAEGRFFSVGGDLAGLGADVNAMPQAIRKMTSTLHIALQRLVRLDAPIVACVQGTAMGGAVALIANCDLVFSSASAKFGAAYSRIGFSCDAGSSFGLASRMGIARARRFLILAEVLSAHEAAACGLVDFVHEDADVAGRAQAAATTLAAGPTRAFGETRRLVSTALAQPFESQLEDEARTLARIGSTHDAREGVQAMTDKRAASFTRA